MVSKKGTHLQFSLSNSLPRLIIDNNIPLYHPFSPLPALLPNPQRQLTLAFSNVFSDILMHTPKQHVYIAVSQWFHFRYYILSFYNKK